MASERELRETVKRLAAQHGAHTLEDLAKVGLAVEDISPTKRSKIERWLLKVSPGGLSTTLQPQTQRWANSFKLGADPEFIFSVTEDGVETRINASAHGLRPGFAFGADNNGRLAEIRPAPNVSALKVTASMLHTMRWLAMLHPKTVQFSWRCFPVIENDGIGGHIHLGRKQKSRPQEVQALNYLTACLTILSVFDKEGVLVRPQTGYGRPNDWRKQVHGYEYRSMPSWLDSPEQAFLVLTLAKLAVHDPELFSTKPTEKTAGARLYSTLAYYRPKDDDAALALALLQRLNGFPRFYGRDFKRRWGIGFPLGYTEKLDVDLIPDAMKPDDAAIEDLYKYLLLAEPIPSRIPTCNWKEQKRPGGFHALWTQNHAREIGMGDLVAGLYASKSLPVSIQSGAGVRLEINLPNVYAQQFAAPFRVKVAEMLPGPVETRVIENEYEGMSVFVPRWLRENDTLEATRRLLLSDVFPLWGVGAATKDNYTIWCARFREKKVLSKPSLEAALKSIKNVYYSKTSEEQRAVQSKKKNTSGKVMSREELTRLLKKKKKLKYFDVTGQPLQERNQPTTEREE